MLSDNSQQLKILKSHIHNLAALFIQNCVDEILSIHLAHAHFAIFENIAILSVNYNKPHCCWVRTLPSSPSSPSLPSSPHSRSSWWLFFQKVKWIKCFTFIAHCFERALLLNTCHSKFAVACNDFWTLSCTFNNKSLLSTLLRISSESSIFQSSSLILKRSCSILTSKSADMLCEGQSSW